MWVLVKPLVSVSLSLCRRASLQSVNSVHLLNYRTLIMSSESRCDITGRGQEEVLPSSLWWIIHVNETFMSSEPVCVAVKSWLVEVCLGVSHQESNQSMTVCFLSLFLVLFYRWESGQTAGRLFFCFPLLNIQTLLKMLSVFDVDSSCLLWCWFHWFGVTASYRMNTKRSNNDFREKRWFSLY